MQAQQGLYNHCQSPSESFDSGAAEHGPSYGSFSKLSQLIPTVGPDIFEVLARSFDAVTVTMAYSSKYKFLLS